jgi:hypothetical protein
MTKEEILKAIKEQEEYISIKEMSDDFYHTKGTYQEDKRQLNSLKKMLEEIK